MSRFDVLVEPFVDKTVRAASTPREVRRVFVDVYRDLQLQGCAAASYRLSGPGAWPHHCVRRLPRGWRLVMDFPDDSTVRLLVLASHDSRSDPYLELARLLGVDRADGLDSGKPPCCGQDGSPPASPQALGVDR